MIEVTDDMIKESEKLVYLSIKKITGSYTPKNINGYELEDIEQIGRIGLFKAYQKFNPELGIKFSTYAIPKITGEILNEIRDTKDSFKIPRKSNEIYMKIKKREIIPTVEQIMEEFNCNESYARIALDLVNVRQISIDLPLDTDKETPIGNIIEDENAAFADDVLKKVELDYRLSILDEKQREIIKYQLKGKTQREISKKMNISQVHISRLSKRAVESINQNFNYATV